MDYFTITLNSSDASFESNTIANFKTCLPKELLLDGKWVVGLAEFHYTKSWFNVPNTERITLFENNMTMPCSMVINPGWYDGDDLMKIINDIVAEGFKQMIKIATSDKEEEAMLKQTRSKASARKIDSYPPKVSFNANSECSVSRVSAPAAAAIVARPRSSATSVSISKLRSNATYCR